MKIVSKFIDYYDGLQSMGHDDSLIYNRKTVEYNKDATLPKIISDLLDVSIHVPNDKNWAGEPKYRFGGTEQVTGKDKRTWYIKYHTKIIFCGKPYVALSFESPWSNPHLSVPPEYFYTPDQVFRFCESRGIDLYQYSKKRTWPPTTKTLKEAIVDFFKVRELDKDWLIENKVICVALDYVGMAPYSGLGVIVNPCLKDYQFAKAVDPYQAWQELEMWIGGTLAFPQNQMVEISDESKVKKHGFDPKYGFRKRPTK